MLIMLLDPNQIDHKESLARDETSSKDYNLISDDQTVDISMFGKLILNVFSQSLNEPANSI